MNSIPLLIGATAAGTGGAKDVPLRTTTAFVAKLSGTSGAISATVELYGSNDPYWSVSKDNAAKTLLGTYTLSGTGSGADISADSGVIAVTAQYTKYWAKITAISGTGATVDAWAGA